MLCCVVSANCTCRRFAPLPFALTLNLCLFCSCRGITNDNVDCGVDVWRTVTFPLLRQLTGVEDGFELKVCLTAIGAGHCWGSACVKTHSCPAGAMWT